MASSSSPSTARIPAEETCSSVDSQSESPLFRLPLELRRSIYSYFINPGGYHIVSTDGDLSLTPCLGVNLYDGDVGWGRMAAQSDPYKYDKQERRLESRWGPHWMCEEFWMAGVAPITTLDAVYGTDLRSLYPALRLCKKSYADIMMWVAIEADFHITDLETLNLMLGSRSKASSDINGPAFCFQYFIQNRIEKLSVTLSRPLSFFRALEMSYSSDNGPWSSQQDNHRAAWIHWTHRLNKGLPNLKKLVLWLDHSGREYWSVVNERAILAPVLGAVETHRSLDFVVVLPKVHPSIANIGKHFWKSKLELGSEEDNSLPRFIHRVLRQRHRSYGRRYTYVLDFPHLLDHPLYERTTLAKIEELEEKAWRAGVDLHDKLKGIKYVVWDV